MSGRTKWSDVRDRRLPDDAARARYDAARQVLEADLASHRRTLGELRRARELTQTQLAKSLRVSQAQVSRIETQADLYLSTLRTYVEAMGGELELRVVFGDGAWAEVELDADEAARRELIDALRRKARRGHEPTTEGSAVKVVRWRRDAAPDGRTVRHVLPHPDGWSVTKEGARRPSVVVRDQRTAIGRAKQIVAKGGGGAVVVHPASARTGGRTAG